MDTWKAGLGAAALGAFLVCAAASPGKRRQIRSTIPPLCADSIRMLSPDRAGAFVDERLFALEPELKAAWSRNDQTSAKLLLTALTGFLAEQGDADEKDFPHLLRMMDFCDPAFSFVREDEMSKVMRDSFEGGGRAPARYYTDYLRFHLVCERKEYVIACCRVLLCGLLSSLGLACLGERDGGENHAFS